MALCDKCGATDCLFSADQTAHCEACDQYANLESRVAVAEQCRKAAEERERAVCLERDEIKQDLADLKKKWKQALRERDAARWCMSGDLNGERCVGCPAEHDKELCDKLQKPVLNKVASDEAQEDVRAARRERDEARKSVVELDGKLREMSDRATVTLAERVVELDGKLREMSDRATVTLAERDEARRFGEAAAEKYNALLKDVDVVTCAFCGYEYPRGTPRYGDGKMVEHMKICLKHPMRAVEEQLRGLEYVYGELKIRNTVLETKVAEGEKQLSYDVFLLEELRTQLDEKERVDKAGSTANKRLRDESDSLRNRISADAGRIKGLISVVNRLVARLPRVRVADNNAVLCTGCSAVFYRYGSINLADPCKPDCIFTAAQKVLADCKATTPL